MGWEMIVSKSFCCGTSGFVFVWMLFKSMGSKEKKPHHNNKTNKKTQKKLKPKQKTSATKTPYTYTHIQKTQNQSKQNQKNPEPKPERPPWMCGSVRGFSTCI